MAVVAIIGSGLIGRAWAISFVRAGHEVRLWSPTVGRAEEAREQIAGLLQDLELQGLLTKMPADQALAKVLVCHDLESALSGAQWVQENALEDVTIKRELFAKLDRLSDSAAILASSTSDIAASQFTEGLSGRARCVVVHPLNPPYLMPAVEVVPSQWTSPETVAQACRFMEAIGQSPIVIEHEDRGFVTIRLQGALMQEAFRIVDEGLASPEDVDRAIRDGLALRWSIVGPFETIDLNSPKGVREYVERYQPLYAKLAQSHSRVVDWAGPVLDTIEKSRRKVLSVGGIKQRQRWRDRKLMALAATLQKKEP